MRRASAALVVALIGCGGQGAAPQPQQGAPAASAYVRTDAHIEGSAPPLPVPPPQASSPSPAPAPPSASQPAPVAESGPCPGDMVLAGRACVDRFEAPNREGEKPIVMVDASEAEAWCAERGKRLCSEDEWVRACGGPSGWPFPYGARHLDGACHDDGSWQNPSWSKLAKWPSDEAKAELARLDRAEVSGKRERCVSAEGARDMTGNVAEWVRRTRKNDTNHPHVVKGCFWGKCFRPPHTPTCDYVNFMHPSGWRSYEIGFRCCADPRKL